MPGASVFVVCEYTVSRMPSAIALAISLKFSSKILLSVSLLINPTSTRTAGIWVLFKTTRLGRSVIPRSSKPASASSLLIFFARVWRIPESLYTRDSMPLYWLFFSDELRCIEIK